MNRLRSGMTFFEVSLVVLVIGILTAIGTPHFARSTRANNARNASTQIADYVNYVRETAINEGRETEIVIDETNDRFSSSNVDFPSRPGSNISVPLKATFDQSIEVTGSFDGQTTLRFDLEGVPNVNGSPLLDGWIRVESPGFVYAIRVNAGTGLSSVSQIADETNTTEASQTGEVDGTSGATSGSEGTYE